MSNGNFWLKNGKQSVGGSGHLGWAAVVLVTILLYAYAPPFKAAVNEIFAILVASALIVGAVALLILVAMSQSRRR